MSGPNLTRDYGSLPPRSKVSDIGAAEMQDIASRGQARNMMEALEEFYAARKAAQQAERYGDKTSARGHRADARAALDGHPELLAALGFDPRHVVLTDIATCTPGQTVAGAVAERDGSLRLDFESGDALCVAADGALRWEAQAVAATPATPGTRRRVGGSYYDQIRNDCLTDDDHDGSRVAGPACPQCVHAHEGDEPRP